MRIRPLTIKLYYDHPTAGAWSVEDLSRFKGVIAVEDMNQAAFCQAYGVLAMFHNRVFKFLYTDGAIDQFSYAHFLLSSLVGLTDVTLPEELERLRYGPQLNGRDEVVGFLGQNDRTQLFLQRRGDELLLSYLDEHGQAPDDRESPFFEGFVLQRDEFRDEATLNLDAWVKVVNDLAQWGPLDSEAQRIVTLWRQHRALLTPHPTPTPPG
ncbi:hypothetical protein L6R49_17275 [Myxococcota bacterium]|nr:hypothetical protein [Myxococcota bacterium]